MRQLFFVLTILVAFTIQSLTGFGGPLISMPIGIALLGVAAVKPAITCSAGRCICASCWPEIAEHADSDSFYSFKKCVGIRPEPVLVP